MIDLVLRTNDYETVLCGRGDQAVQAFHDSNPDLILLDNMSPALCAEAVSIVNGATKLEASGGISLEDAKAYADSGVDYIAIGALTHSAVVLDIGLDLRAE
jgi:nicotinate-nucleotide pyrophosphorylase (carboxylating)